MLLFESFFLDSMQKYMSCKGACLASVGTDQPAEVVDDAPGHLVYFLICIKVSVIFGQIINWKYFILQ